MIQLALAVQAMLSSAPSSCCPPPKLILTVLQAAVDLSSAPHTHQTLSFPISAYSGYSVAIVFVQNLRPSEDAHSAFTLITLWRSYSHSLRFLHDQFLFLPS
ncbi:unnamed protein product [Calicophoron daubneyi]|uniref:Secreted protein n=1 Tax=Calicophoron daubneyi TaxID=300641 RepID=A0AAV2SZR8_CALDB